MLLLLYFLLLLIPIFPCKLIETSYGTVRGASLQISGRQFYKFLGVPHAKPPIGNLRFKLPEPPKSWSGILDAKEYQAACPSNSTVSSSKQKWMDEDCLYMNIVTSEKCLSSSCPVIFYIHGGVLNYDSAVQYSETFMAEAYAAKDIVFVLPAMRLGVLGLLALEDEALVPRNLALYDIIAALEYTDQEISNFGGNPNEVTLMGHSMGGGIVKAFAFSQLIDAERRLFKRSIALSGGVHFKDVQEQRKDFRSFIGRTGCSRPSEAEVLDCLRSQSWQQILHIQSELEVAGTKISGMSFGLPIMHEDTTILQFQRNPPVRDLLISSTKDEFPNSDIGTNIGFSFGFVNNEIIGKKYRDDAARAEREGWHFDSYESHLVYMGNVLYGRELKRIGANVYLFEYDQPPYSLHSSDLPFIIGAHMFDFSDDDRSTATLYNEIIVNFVHGRPMRKGFEQFDGENLTYYSLIILEDQDRYPCMRDEYHREVINYWEQNITEVETLANKVKGKRSYGSDLAFHQNQSGFSTFAPYFLIFTVVLILVFAIISKQAAMKKGKYIRLQ